MKEPHSPWSLVPLCLACPANDGRSSSSLFRLYQSLLINEMVIVVAPDGFCWSYKSFIPLFNQGQCKGWLLKSAVVGWHSNRRAS